MQNTLINRGYKITANGIFRSDTKAVVIAYQKSRGLATNGITGYDAQIAIVND